MADLSDFSPSYLAQLHQALDKHFDEEELRTLCFALRVDYDTLPAQGKGNRARELVNYLARRQRISELQQMLQVERPSLNWAFSEQVAPSPEFLQLQFNAPPFAALVAVSGPINGTWIFLTEQTRRVIFGRRADVRIEDFQLSGRHFAVIVTLQENPDKKQRDYQVAVMDIASTNGTFVNGRLANERLPIQHGDQIQAGGSTFRYIRFDTDPLSL